MPIDTCLKGHAFTEENTRLYTDKRNGREYRACRRCGAEAAKQYRETHPGYVAKHQKIYQKRHPDRVREGARRRRARLRAEVIAAYGSVCVCCSETDVRFLTLDHVNGGGRQHRAKSGDVALQDARRRGFPADYQVLCFNCNCARAIYGLCPHIIGPATVIDRVSDLHDS